MKLVPIILAVILLGFSTPAYAADGVMCTKEYKPVCASHQVQCIRAPCYPVYQTYGNMCEMNAAGSTFIHDGACTEKETGPIKPHETYVPPKGCVAWFDGCNSCSKSANGETMCTLMACAEGNTAPGKCTAYESPQPPQSGGSVGHGHQHSTSSPPATATGTSAQPTPAATQHGFFQRMWGWFHTFFRLH